MRCHFLCSRLAKILIQDRWRIFLHCFLIWITLWWYFSNRIIILFAFVTLVVFAVTSDTITASKNCEKVWHPFIERWMGSNTCLSFSLIFGVCSQTVSGNTQFRIARFSYFGSQSVWRNLIFHYTICFFTLNVFINIFSCLFFSFIFSN